MLLLCSPDVSHDFFGLLQKKCKVHKLEILLDEYVLYFEVAVFPIIQYLLVDPLALLQYLQLCTMAKDMQGHTEKVVLIYGPSSDVSDIRVV